MMSTTSQNQVICSQTRSYNLEVPVQRKGDKPSYSCHRGAEVTPCGDRGHHPSAVRCQQQAGCVAAVSN